MSFCKPRVKRIFGFARNKQRLVIVLSLKRPENSTVTKIKELYGLLKDMSEYRYIPLCCIELANIR